MGEAVYYLKANYDKKKEKEIRAGVEALIKEGIESENFWQNNRGCSIDTDRKQWSPATFWRNFKKKFPTIYRYLDYCGVRYNGRKIKDSNDHNDLAGQIDFGWNWDECKESIVFDDGEFRYSALVWHFADWTPFCKFLEDEFGMKNARWISDEYANPFDGL